MPGEHLSQKLPLAPPKNPFLAKNVLWGVKKGVKFFLADLTSGQNIPNPKNMFKKNFFSKLQDLEVRICVQPNFPIINLILLNGFYKFAKSMGPNTIEGYGPSIPSIRSNSIKLLKQIMCLLSNYLAFYVGIYATVKAVLTQCLQAVSAVQAAYIGWYHVNPPVQRVQNVYGKGGRESLKPNYGRPNLPLVSRICSTKCCCPKKPTL